jgi:hypothetical protein
MSKRQIGRIHKLCKNITRRLQTPHFGVSFFYFWKIFLEKVLTKKQKWCKIIGVMLCYAEVYQMTLDTRG